MSNLKTAIPRVDGPIKVTGAARYAGDQNLAGQLYAVFVAATIPSGQVLAVDAGRTLAMRGVMRVLTAADMPRVHADLDKVSVPPLATRFMPMQTDEIIHEGQPIAIVLAESLEAAEAGAAAVRVSYRRAPFQAPERASAAAADPAKGNYSKSSALDLRKGDADAAIADATHKRAGP